MQTGRSKGRTKVKCIQVIVIFNFLPPVRYAQEVLAEEDQELLAKEQGDGGEGRESQYFDTMIYDQ